MDGIFQWDFALVPLSYFEYSIYLISKMQRSLQKDYCHVCAIVGELDRMENNIL